MKRRRHRSFAGVSDARIADSEMALAEDQAKRRDCSRALKSLMSAHNYFGRAVESKYATRPPSRTPHAVAAFRRYCMTPKARGRSQGKWWSKRDRKTTFGK